MKNGKKLLSLGCTVALLVSLVSVSYGAGNGMDRTKAADTQEVDAIQEALEEFEEISDVVSHSDTAGKEETVYALLDANGQLQQTIVSEWLKNPDGSKTLTDSTELTDLTVVKGDAEYKQGKSKNQIIWTSGGSDIYYQGNSKKELPVDVNISYELDGKKVTAEELSGASGHLKLTFTYTNHVSKVTTIHGEKRTIYQPFVMISGMMLDNSKAQNITIDNGTAVNSGDDTMVFGMAMPGLKESLGLEDVAIEIPETVTVEADVTDFSFMMTLTVASNTVLSQLGLDDIDSIQDLKADMDQLTSGMSEIVDGATQLNDGAGELSDGTDALSDGTKELFDGTTSLASGAHELSDGVTELDTGAVELKDGVALLKGKTPELVTGVESLTSATNQLSTGLDALTQTNDSINEGAEKVADGLSALHSTLNSTESQNQLKSLTGNSAAFYQALTQSAGALTQTVTSYSYSSGSVATQVAALEQYAQQLESTDPTTAAYIQGMIAAYKGLYDNADDVQSSVSGLAGAYDGINQGINKVTGNFATITKNVADLSDGAESLKEGVASYTENVDTVYENVQKLDEGAGSLRKEVPSLISGIDQLSDGASKLKKGTSKLGTGTSRLVKGADKVNNGTSDLKDGVSELEAGVKELVTGTGDLKDGVIKFDEEGIQKLAKIVTDDLEMYYDRLKALQDYAEEYTSYGGCEENVECSVKFIYKTDGME